MIRDRVRQEFEQKNSHLQKIRREAIFILNQENYNLRRSLTVNKNPDFCLISLREGIYAPHSNQTNSPLFHPDLKDIMTCMSAGLMDESIPVLAGNLNDQLNVLAKNRIRFTLSYKGDKGTEQTLVLDDPVTLKEFLAENRQIYALRVGLILFQCFLQMENTGGNYHIKPDSLRIFTSFIWHINENKLVGSLHELQKEKEEIIKLRKFAMILPEGISGILEEELKKQHITNISCFENAAAFNRDKSDVSVSEILAYLEKTEYREIEVCMDYREKIEFLTLCCKYHRLLNGINSKDKRMIYEMLPKDVTESDKKNLHEILHKSPAKKYLPEKTEVLAQFALILEMENDAGRLLYKLTPSLEKECAEQLRHLVIGYMAPGFPSELRDQLSRQIHTEIPHQNTFNTYSQQETDNYLEKVFLNKEVIISFAESNLNELISRRISKKLCTNYLKCAEQPANIPGGKLTAVFPELAVAPGRNDSLQPQQDKELIFSFFDSISVEYNRFIARLKQHRATAGATALLYGLASADEKSDGFWQLFSSYLAKTPSSLRVTRLMTLLKNPEWKGVCPKVVSGISMLSNNYGLYVCMSSEKPVLETHPSLAGAVAVEIPKEIEASYQEIIARDNINLQNKEEVIQYITRETDRRIQMLQKQKNQNNIEIYLIETVVLLLKLIFSLLKKNLSPELIKVKIKQDTKDRFEAIRSEHFLLTEKVKKLEQQAAGGSEKKAELLAKRDEAEHALTQAGNELTRKEEEFKSVFQKLSKVVEKQRMFSYAFAKFLLKFIFPEKTHELSTNRVFNFSDEELEYITQHRVCFITFSGIFISFIKFCIQHDKIPEDIFYIGNQLEIPQNAGFIIFGPDVEKTLIDAAKDLHPEAKKIHLELKNYEQVLDSEERLKRTLREHYKKLQGEVESAGELLNTLLDREQKITDLMTRFSGINNSIEAERIKLAENIQQKEAEKSVLTRDIKILFQEMDKIDGKFNQTIARIKAASGMINDTKELGEESMKTIEDLAAELIKVYGEFDFLLLIKKFSDLAAALTGTIKNEVLRNIQKKDRLLIPSAQISRVLIIHDKDESSLLCATDIREILSVMLDIAGKISTRQFNYDFTNYRELDENTVFFIIANDQKHHLRNLLAYIYKVKAYLPEANIVLLTDYTPLKIGSGDKFKNELAININNLIRQSILINSHYIKKDRQIKLLGLLHSVLNFDKDHAVSRN
ncbi:hypothetical protein CHS0354_006935 [Potamilus streckersoni]|uniref:Uncharacterized protein n=1 Tax=Potamilus streckersoni TaxID=2493646 RepID=A0AAE0WC84_9BIVA|nr:hypothetical protein CHS0354_006935 [Potamilus streckersoni]